MYGYKRILNKEEMVAGHPSNKEEMGDDSRLSIKEKMGNLQALKDISILEVARRLHIEVNSNNQAYCFNRHDEKSPSLSFNIPKNTFKCFGCGIQGSNIDLVMFALNYELGQAIKYLEDGCMAYGTQHTICSTQLHKKRNTNLYKDIMDAGNKIEAIRYLKQRGISRRVVEFSGIKTIPLNEMKAFNRALHKNYSIEELESAGIISTKFKTPYFSLTKNRLLIPYYRGKTIMNIQGRDIDNNEGVKYKMLTGIETSIYNINAILKMKKGDILYICEGAIDALSCLEFASMTGDNSFNNAVGITGVKGFKDRYYKLFMPYRICIVHDNDTAGIEFNLNIKSQFVRYGKSENDLYSIDFDGLKSKYKINGEIKDINDVVMYAKNLK